MIVSAHVWIADVWTACSSDIQNELLDAAFPVSLILINNRR